MDNLSTFLTNLISSWGKYRVVSGKQKFKQAIPLEAGVVMYNKVDQWQGGVRTVVVSIQIGSQSQNGHF